MHDAITPPSDPSPSLFEIEAVRAAGVAAELLHDELQGNV